MALLFEDREDYSSSLEYVKRALNIQELKLPLNHHELVLSGELVKRLLAKNNVAM